MAKPELGSKRQCQHCGAKFFDLNKDPIVCPKCGTVFHVASMSRAAPRAAEAESDAEPEARVELVSLEDAEAGTEKVLVTAEDEVEIEDDDTAADETFLEEEEEGDSDDVAGLIDGDIEEDEEP